MKAAVIANIVTLPIATMLSGLPIALVAGALWTVIALPLRSTFAALVAPRPNPDFSTARGRLVGEA